MSKLEMLEIEPMTPWMVARETLPLVLKIYILKNLEKRNNLYYQIIL